MPMPPKKPDYVYPVVRIDCGFWDMREACKAGNRGARYASTLYTKSFDDGYYIVNDRLGVWLHSIRHRRKEHNLPALDEGLLHMMLSKFSKAAYVVQVDKKGKPIIENDAYLIELKTVGCRVYRTQEQLAEEYGVSTETIRKQIDIMRDEGLIINQRTGYGKRKRESWYEFSVICGWRGDQELRKAYLKTQRTREGLIVVQDGKEHKYGGLEDAEELDNAG